MCQKLHHRFRRFCMFQGFKHYIILVRQGNVFAKFLKSAKKCKLEKSRCLPQKVKSMVFDIFFKPSIALLILAFEAIVQPHIHICNCTILLFLAHCEEEENQENNNNSYYKMNTNRIILCISFFVLVLVIGVSSKVIARRTGDLYNGWLLLTTILHFFLTLVIPMIFIVRNDNLYHFFKYQIIKFFKLCWK